MIRVHDWAGNVIQTHAHRGGSKSGGNSAVLGAVHDLHATHQGFQRDIPISNESHGRGAGVGRDLGVGAILGVGVAVTVDVAVEVGVAVDVPVAVAVGVGVGVAPGCARSSGQVMVR